MPKEPISVVIPVYNAEETLPGVVERLAAVLPRLADSYEAILVNDGSGSWPLVEGLTHTHPWIRGINLRRNYGQHNATLAGIRAAKGKIIITMDDDGQHPSDGIDMLLTKLDEGYDVVYGYAAVAQHEWWRNPLTGAVKWLLEKSGTLPDARRISAFRAFRAPLREAFAGCYTPYPVIDVLLRWGTDRIGFIAIPHAPRQGGRTSSNISKLLTIVMHMVTAHSLVPIRWIELLGLALLLFGVITSAMLWMATGLIILAIGLVGEYAARHYHLTLGKPQALVKEETQGGL